MTEQLVSLETAKLAKEVGFDWECRYSINEDGDYDRAECHIGRQCFTQDDVDNVEQNGYAKSYLSPTQSLLQKWLRDECAWHLIAIPKDGSWTYHIDHCDYEVLDEYMDNLHSECADGVFHGCFNTYELAIESGLKKSLRIITQAKNNSLEN